MLRILWQKGDNESNELICNMLIRVNVVPRQIHRGAAECRVQFMLHKSATQGTMIVVLQLVKIINVFSFGVVLCPDFIGIPLRFTREDDSPGRPGQLVK